MGNVAFHNLNLSEKQPGCTSENPAEMRTVQLTAVNTRRTAPRPSADFLTLRALLNGHFDCLDEDRSPQ